MKKIIKIGNRKIGAGEPAFIVAEMSGNHGQDFNQAVEIVKAAAAAGADAIKLQTYTPDTMTIDSKEKWFWVGGEKNPESWHGQTFYDLYQKAYTPWAWVPKLKKIAENLGLVFFSTPFDETAVDFLEKNRVLAYKIAAYESQDASLLKRVAKTGKPVMVSVGFSISTEVEFTVKTLRQAGAKDIIILQCTTSYARRPRITKTNLKTMSDISKRFKVLVGLSDNMGGIESSVLAVALGASVIEKHLVINHGEALDDRFSLDQNEFTTMVAAIRQKESLIQAGGKIVFSKREQAMIGKISYGPQTSEEKFNRNFRRSIFVVADIKKGDKFTLKNVRSIRPGYGLPPKELSWVLNKRAKVDILRGTPLSFKLVV